MMNNAHALQKQTQTVVHILARMKPSCTAKQDDIRRAIGQVLAKQRPDFYPKQRVDVEQDSCLRQWLDDLVVCDTLQHCVKTENAVVEVEVFQLSEVVPVTEGADDHDLCENAEDTTSCEVTTLPNCLLHDLWESLIFDASLKLQLMHYVETAMLFSHAGVNPTLVTFNRVVLLHGPPGTGKTSLCKALAQRMAIRLGKSFDSCQLVEINAHSLFSKWFSESGKLVGKLFARIRMIAEDPGCLCFILIDEVESLAAARKCALSGAEPSDAIRVVNALLTQLDSLRRFRNVFVMATSNITEAIDIAFIDRADLKLYIGPPSLTARCEILLGGAMELVRTKLVLPAPSVPTSDAMEDDPLGGQLQAVARSCDGMSGRLLRKIPFLAFARVMQSKGPYPCSFELFLAAMQEQADDQRATAHLLNSC